MRAFFDDWGRYSLRYSWREIARITRPARSGKFLFAEAAAQTKDGPERCDGGFGRAKRPRLRAAIGLCGGKRSKGVGADPMQGRVSKTEP